MPTPFSDEPGWPVNEAALRTYVRFLIDNGLTERIRDAACRRRGGRLLHHDLRGAAARRLDRRGGMRRPACRSPWAARRRARWSWSAWRKRRSDSASTSSRSPARSTSPTPQADFEEYVRAAAEAAPRRRPHRLQYVLDGDEHLARHGGAPRRNPERRRAEMGDAAHRRDGVRDGHVASSPTASPSSTTTSSSPSAPCRRSARAPSRCTSATTGRNGGSSSIDEVEAENYPEIARMLVEEAMPSTTCGPRSSATTPAATAISTSCAWS